MSDHELIAMALANRVSRGYNFDHPQVHLSLTEGPPAWRLKWAVKRTQGYGTELFEEPIGLFNDGLPVLTERARGVLQQYAATGTFAPKLEPEPAHRTTSPE